MATSDPGVDIIIPPSKKQKLDNDADEKTQDSGEDKVVAERSVPRETDMGIEEYISKLQGFSGIIKQRYSDFLVNEIRLDGQVVHLTDMNLNEEKETEENTKTEENVESVPDLTELFGESLEEVKKLHGDQNQDTKVYVQVAEDKELRTKIHEAVKKHFPGLDSRTTEHEGSKCIEVTVASSKGTRNQRWDKNREYCHCVLYKESVDTMQAVNTLAKMLRIPPGKICYAGTKDRRAKTCQQICFHRITQERLHQLNKSKIMRNMSIGNYRYCQSSLQLGDLRGNHFTVVLRNVDASPEQIEASLKSLEEHGFINYYGMQRFGTTSVPTHTIGRCMVQSKWEEAVDLILKPRTGDNPQMAAAREKWAKGKDTAAALKCLGHRQCNERHLLYGLGKKHENDLVGALNFIPRNSRLMYLHSYQSYIWNRVVSKRVRKFGLELQVGDLVMPAPSCHDIDRNIAAKEEPTVINEESRQQHSIYDVVFPLPGHNITLPNNEAKQWYGELLAEDGLSMDKFNHHIRDYALSGDYRHVFVKPERMTWSTHRYNDVTQSLVLSDLEKLKDESLDNVDEGSMRALKVVFSLPSSTYATMALREILKCDTSSAHQSTLNITSNTVE